MKRISVLLVALAMVFGLTATAHAALIVRGTDTLGNQLIYDDDLDITWYDYSNNPNTWQNQVDWASGLTVTFDGIDYTDWRLPIVTDIGNDGCNWAYTGTDCGYNVDTSTGEMAHLFYDELGNLAYYDTTGTGPQAGWGLLTNTGPFNNLQPYYYWSGTEFAPVPDSAWVFDFGYGGQAAYPKEGYGFYAVAVRPGDVSAVPEPGTMLLLGSGLVGLAAFRKRLGRIDR